MLSQTIELSSSCEVFLFPVFWCHFEYKIVFLLLFSTRHHCSVDISIYLDPMDMFFNKWVNFFQTII